MNQLEGLAWKLAMTLELDEVQETLRETLHQALGIELFRLLGRSGQAYIPLGEERA